MHYDFMRSMGWCKKDVTPFLTHLSCVFLALTHRNENTFCSRTFMCPWWLLEQPFGQTLEWPVSWDSIAYDSYISVDLHACETVLKYFPGFSPEFNRNIRRSRYKYQLTHWGRNNDDGCLAHIFMHFLDMKLTKICSFAELVIKLVCWLTRLRHNNILPHKHYSGVTCA